MAWMSLLLGLSACGWFGIKGSDGDSGTGSDGEDVTLIGPRVKVGFPQNGPTSHCSATVRTWFDGDEIDPGVTEKLNPSYGSFEDIVPTAFIPDGGGAAAWHCVYGAVAVPLPYETYYGALHYEVLGLVPDELDPWDPSFIPIYQGQCTLDASGSQIESLESNYVNFTTGLTGCVISTNPLSGYPEL